VAEKPKILQGSIFWTDVRDPDTGKSAGNHAVVVASPPEDIEAGLDLRVFVITSSMDNPPAGGGWFDIKHHPDVDPDTGLYMPCVLKGTWQDIIPQAVVTPTKYRCPSKTFKQLRNWLRDKQKEIRK